MKSLLIAFGAVCAAASAAAAHADIYRCVDPGGHVAYGDAPCPPSAAMAANITEAVQCTAAECRAQQERARAEAEERLRNDRVALIEMREQRLRAEALHLDMQLKRQELRRLQSMDASAASGTGSEVYFPSVPLPYQPYYGGDGYGLPGYGDCRKFDCIGMRPLPPGAVRPSGHRRHDYGTSFTLKTRSPHNNGGFK